MQFGQLNRRDFISVLGCAVAWPIATGAQQMIQKRRIAVLMAYEESVAEAQAWVAAFREAFRKLGWMEGGDFQIDVRWATGDKATIARFAKEMVASQPDLILSSSTPTTAALLEQTRTIPIVFGIVTDPVGSGFVTSFPRPGGNATGFTNFEPTMGGKWLELLKEIAPRVNRATFLLNPVTGPHFEYYLGTFKAIGCTAKDAAAAKHSRWPIAQRSQRWQLATASRLYMRIAFSPNLAACCPMGVI
jgi:putative ABC transport system substrate-binding protein